VTEQGAVDFAAGPGERVALARESQATGRGGPTGYNPRMRKWAVTSALLLSCGALLVAGDDTALREFLQDDKYADGWIYEDIDAGYEQATESGKPLLVCFCCVP